MDQPALEPARHRAALCGLARINAFSGAARAVWSPLADLARELRTPRLRLLDVATGAGDIPLALWRKANRAGLHLEIHGTDISDRALISARERAEARGAPIRFSRIDALADELPGTFDAVISSLFLHHLDEGPAISLLAKMGQAAEHLVLVNDLRRCRRGLLLAHVVPWLLTRSDVVHVDAVRSARAAFTLDEARALARAAGLEGATVRSIWPCRFLLAWRSRR